MKKQLTIEEADLLFEKYYDGETTNAEQELLQDYLKQEDLPTRFEAERALFGYFAEEKVLSTASRELHLDIETPLQSDDLTEKEKIPPRNLWLRLNPVLKWSFAAAVLLIGVFILDNRIQAQKSDIAYIDGVRCTDNEKVTALAIASIEQIDLGLDEVAGTVNKMNDKDLVESQLQQFPELK
jgi:hypothetical protein